MQKTRRNSSGFFIPFKKILSSFFLYLDFFSNFVEYLFYFLMKFVKIILYIILFFVSFISHCQTDSSYYFKRISIEHGLSQSGVTAIVRDHKGILWIGTRQGINKVERNRIKKYTEYHIFHLYEDTNQKLGH